MVENVNAVVIGGGFFGVNVALYLANRMRGGVVLVEAEDELLTRASLINQARVHGGYHYPRSLVTGYASRKSLPRFCRDWAQSVSRPKKMVYAIARRDSKTSAKQFVNYCRAIGTELYVPDASVRQMFDRTAVEDVFEVEEPVFDATKLRAWAQVALEQAKVDVRLRTRVTGVRNQGHGAVVSMEQTGELLEAKCPVVFNCTYSGLNHVGGADARTTSQLKHELAELALVEMPAALKNAGVTVMDGPFFSTLPYPSRNLHSFTHVRYTPHRTLTDDVDPAAECRRWDKRTKVDLMLRDSVSFMPGLADARYVESLYEIKTVLVRNESNDGRPILFEQSTTLPSLFSILGGKLDNIFDVFAQLDSAKLLEGNHPCY